MLPVAVFLCLLIPSMQSNSKPRTTPKPCQSITLPQCKSMPYNLTRFPNDFKHRGPEEVKQSFQDHKYDILLKTKCSDQLMFYLCAKLFPICIDSIMTNPSPNPTTPSHFSKPIQPCRSVCRKVKRDCLPTIRALNETWPENDPIHDCDLLPQYDKDVCISPKAFVTTTSKGKNQRGGCVRRCKRQKRQKPVVLGKNTFDYELKARLKQITNNPDGTQTLKVKVLLFIRAPASINQCSTHKTIIWRGCRCFTPVTGSVYLFVGHVDAATNQMVVQRNGRIQLWDRKLLAGNNFSYVRAARRGKNRSKCSQRKKRPA